MITLHGVYEEGSEPVKAAVLAFGDRHPLTAAPDQRDWKRAERHFTYLIEHIMGKATRPQGGAAATVRRADNEAIDLLLALATVPDYRCPICVGRDAQ